MIMVTRRKYRQQKGVLATRRGDGKRKGGTGNEKGEWETKRRNGKQKGGMGKEKEEL